MQKAKLQVKIKTIIKRVGPFFYILAIWFIFASPFFFQNKVPYSSTNQVNFFPPWKEYPQFWGPVKNNAMPDVIDQLYPWKKFTIDQLKQGNLPLWNPNSFSGNPHLANYQTAVFSPFNLLFFILPFVDAWSLLVLLQPLLAGVFMYLFLRSLKLHDLASVFGSVSYMFCGFITVWMAYGTMSMIAALLPLLLFTIEKYYQTSKKSFLILLCFGIAASFFSGHFQIAVYTVSTSFLYGVVRGLRMKQNPGGVIIAFVAGLAVSFIQIVPTFFLYQHSIRSSAYSIGPGIPWLYLPTLIAPDFYGNPVTRNNWFGYYAEWASFIGILPMTFAVFALFLKRNFYTIFFASIGLGTLLLTVHTPLIGTLESLKFPFLSTSGITRLIIISSFSLITVAAIGFDTTFQTFRSTKQKHIFLTFGITVLCLGSIFAGAMLLPKEYVMVAIKNSVLPLGLFGMLGILFGVNLVVKKKTLLVGSVVFILLLSTFDSLRFAQKWMPFDPRQLVFPDLPVITAMKKQIGNGRVYGISGAQIDTYYSIPTLGGYDPLYIGRYGDFIRTSATGKFIQGERSIVKVEGSGNYTKRVIDFLGANIIFHPVLDTKKSWAYPVWKDKKTYTKVFGDAHYQLYTNADALSRARLYHDYEVIPDSKKLLERFFADEFRYDQVLLLEKDPGVQLVTPDEFGSVEFVEDTPNRIVLKVQTSAPALLLLADPYYPKWRARVNGKETEILQADYAFRSIVVPQGSFQVIFEANLL